MNVSYRDNAFVGRIVEGRDNFFRVVDKKFFVRHFQFPPKKLPRVTLFKLPAIISHMTNSSAITPIIFFFLAKFRTGFHGVEVARKRPLVHVEKYQSV